jgi:hypothetical protein
VRRPVIDVGRIRIQDGLSVALPHDCRPRSLSRRSSSSDSTTSVKPLMTTLHPDLVRAS